MKKIALLFIFTFLAVGLLMAEPQADIKKANKAYQEGFYENAISLYEKVIHEGYTSSELYYNLGNAYFKTDQIPSAILYYERAKKLDPNNEDILYNLKIANSKIIDKIDQLPQLFYVQWWNNVKQLFSPDGWAVNTIVLLFLFFAIAVTFLLSGSVKVRKILLTSGLIIMLVTVLVFIISIQTYDDANNKHEAIVYTASLPVKSSPEESGIDLFVIHEGLKVQIIDELSGWKEIKIDNGSKGWVKTEALKAI